ncbi:hypothetical protein WMY93_015199 [Mugilogobius chulae]|uniref:Uncharacterized protein n=1 Tax=Mugilogobius chulae TaxID=88201 RepID=A0AAW0P0X0_9GOBI
MNAGQNGYHGKLACPVSRALTLTPANLRLDPTVASRILSGPGAGAKKDQVNTGAVPRVRTQQRIKAPLRPAKKKGTRHATVTSAPDTSSSSSRAFRPGYRARVTPAQTSSPSRDIPMNRMCFLLIARGASLLCIRQMSSPRAPGATLAHDVIFIQRKSMRWCWGQFGSY